MRQDLGSGVYIPKLLSALSTLLPSVLNTQIERTGEGMELGNSFSSTANSTEARPQCKTLALKIVRVS